MTKPTHRDIEAFMDSLGGYIAQPILIEKKAELLGLIAAHVAQETKAPDEAISALCKIGAECHKRKWQFDPEGLPAREVRDRLRKAIRELETIGDMAISAYRAALANTAKGGE